MQLEIACFNVQSALTAAVGADRIELCAAMHLGGITPSLDNFLVIRKEISLPIYVMLRPRGGNFTCTVAELEQMKTSLLQFKENGADGFVFGVLNDKKEVDTTACAQLLAMSGETPCTFHRAIDRTENLEKSLQTIIGLGFKTVLSSGGAKNALAGMGVLAKLQEKYGNTIAIMPGGGVRAANIATIRQNLQTKWIHSSGVVTGEKADFNEVCAMKNYLTSS